MAKPEYNDAQLLNILRLRIKHGGAKAGRMLGLPSERVRTICNRILHDDMNESIKDGVETHEQIISGYWET